jgi:hypothetical protein
MNLIEIWGLNFHENYYPTPWLYFNRTTCRYCDHGYLDGFAHGGNPANSGNCQLNGFRKQFEEYWLGSQ